ncbi:hypothetical protein M0813_10379 [Anaeramoeba flamelloides]|uniref:Uncharacterized protein n=1 Tax=Anaeramoeba flamelloides TaxID=1746091 RepID=A0ABQ8X352_9EUKA|nr:hypothetical protein M0813_10379 [Anaeramoeba flamelloides]
MSSKPETLKKKKNPNKESKDSKETNKNQESQTKKIERQKTKSTNKKKKEKIKTNELQKVKVKVKEKEKEKEQGKKKNEIDQQKGKEKKEEKGQVKEKEKEKEEKKEKEKEEEIQETKLSFPKEYGSSDYNIREGVNKILGETFNLKQLTKELEQKKRLQRLLTEELYSKVLHYYDSFIREMSFLQELKNDLELASMYCKRTRVSFYRTKENSLKDSFSIVDGFYKRRFLLSVVQGLKRIQKAISYKSQIQEYISQLEFGLSIQSIIEAQRFTIDLKQFECLEGIHEEFELMYNQIRSSLDKEFGKQCHSFNEETYEKIIYGFREMDQIEEIPKLERHYFKIELRTNFVNALIKFLNLKPKEVKAAKSKSIRELSFDLDQKSFLPCMISILENTAQILFLHARIGNWWEERVKQNNGNEAIYQKISQMHLESRQIIWKNFEQLFEHFLDQKGEMDNNLNSFKLDLFMKILFLSNQLIAFGEDYAQIESSETIRKIVVERSKSYFTAFHYSRLDDLFEMLKAEMWFRWPTPTGFSYGDLRELRRYINKDEITSKNSPNLHLKEKNSQISHENSNNENNNENENENKSKSKKSEGSISKKTNSGSQTQFLFETGSNQLSFQELYNKNKNPFKQHKVSKLLRLNSFKSMFENQEETNEENNNNINGNSSGNTDDDDDDDDDDDEKKENTTNDEKEKENNSFSLLRQEFNRIQSRQLEENNENENDNEIEKEKEKEKEHKQKDEEKEEEEEDEESGYLDSTDGKGPMLTSIAINVVRIVGKYVKIMELMQPISDFIFKGLTRIYDSYLYVIFHHFVNTHIINKMNNSKALEETKLKFHKELCISDNLLNKMKQIKRYKTLQKIVSLNISDQVDLNSKDTLFGLNQRVVGIESLVYIMDSLDFLKDIIQHFLPTSALEKFKKYWKQTTEVTRELKLVIYKLSARLVINLDPIKQEISTIKWESGMIGADSSPYVESLSQILIQFSQTLSKLDKFTLPDKSREKIWDEIILYVMSFLLDMYSQAKKCSYEGRALMSLDLVSIINRIEKITKIRPVPYTVKVRTYINIYNVPEEDLLNWIKENKDDYTLEQMSNLMICKMGRKTKRKKRQKILAEIEELYPKNDQQTKNSNKKLQNSRSGISLFSKN